MRSEPVSSADTRSGVCVKCDQRSGTAYRMRLRHQDGTYTDAEPLLCDRCLDTLHDVEWITFPTI